MAVDPIPAAINDVVLFDDVKRRVWLGNGNANGAWLIAPDGVMIWAAAALIAAAPRVAEEGAFPAMPAEDIAIQRAVALREAQ